MAWCQPTVCLMPLQTKGQQQQRLKLEHTALLARAEHQHCLWPHPLTWASCRCPAAAVLRDPEYFRCVLAVAEPPWATCQALGMH